MPFFKVKNKNILFIHIPKTAGSSIESWLSSVGSVAFYSTIIPNSLRVTPQHFTIADIRILLDGLVKWDYSFALVRNPYKRLESEYFFRTKHEQKTFGVRPDFSCWLIEQLKHYQNNPTHLDNHFRPQIHFIDETVEVFKLENGLDKIIETLATKYKLVIPKKIPKKNKNKDKSTKIKWSNEALIRTNEIYSEDFKLLEYKMKRSKIKLKK